ncbi:hypothetical protein ACJX0J_033677, partial [Zea mays]
TINVSMGVGTRGGGPSSVGTWSSNHDIIKYLLTLAQTWALLEKLPGLIVCKYQYGLISAGLMTTVYGANIKFLPPYLIEDVIAKINGEEIVNGTGIWGHVVGLSTTLMLEGTTREMYLY